MYVAMERRGYDESGRQESKQTRELAGSCLACEGE